MALPEGNPCSRVVRGWWRVLGTIAASRTKGRIIVLLLWKQIFIVNLREWSCQKVVVFLVVTFTGWLRCSMSVCCPPHVKRKETHRNSSAKKQPLQPWCRRAVADSSTAACPACGEGPAGRAATTPAAPRWAACCRRSRAPPEPALVWVLISSLWNRCSMRKTTWIRSRTHVLRITYNF